PSRRRRRPGRDRPLALRSPVHAGPYREPHRIPRPWPLVLRRHLVQPRLWSPVRRFARRDAGFPGPAVRPARLDPGLLRARVHPGQCRLRAGGRPRQRGVAAPPRTGHRDARTRTSHPADHACRGARLQPVPAHRRARRARGRGGALRGRGHGPGRGIRRTAALERRVPRVRARAGAAALVLLGVLAGPVQAADEPVQEQVPVATEAVVADAVPADEVATDAAPSPAAEPVDDALPLLANASLEPAATPLPEGPRSGLEVYRKFRAGLAEPDCQPGASARWRAHFANAPTQLASPGSDVLPLFGYVVDRLRDAHLPTEFALIPFVESGFRPGARSPQGPAGLWQFIALTARNHKVPVQAGYDGRLSPADSTDAAVRYVKALRGDFAGDWRLGVMSYNAGEYGLLGALRRAGQRPADADPDSLPMPSITKAYVRKRRALSCLLEEAEDREAWLQ